MQFVYSHDFRKPRLPWVGCACRVLDMELNVWRGDGRWHYAVMPVGSDHVCGGTVIPDDSEDEAKYQAEMALKSWLSRHQQKVAHLEDCGFEPGVFVGTPE